MHAETTGRFRHVSIAHFIDALDMFPTDPIGGHRIFRGRWQGFSARQKGVGHIIGIGRL